MDMNEERTWINDFEVGNEFVGFYAVRNPSLQKFNDPSRGSWLRLTLVDKTGSVDAKMWNDADAAHEAIRKSSVVKVDATVEEYQGSVQVIVRQLRDAREGEYDRSDMMATTRHDIDFMWDTVDEKINTIQDPFIEKLLSNFFGDPEFKTHYSEAPAAQKIHHAYLGGLLEHSYEMLKMYEPICALYPAIDCDMVILGILLHDVGKLVELDWGMDISYTDAGKLVGHVILSERIISKAIYAIENFPPERELEILHMILSHHGRYEWGSARRPKSLEACTLHYLDLLGSNVNRFNLLLSSAQKNNQTWTDYDRLLGRSLYNGAVDPSLSLEESGYAE